MRDQEMLRSYRFRADGVVWSRNFLTRPPRPLQRGCFASSLDVAATPPRLRRGIRSPESLAGTAVAKRGRGGQILTISRSRESFSCITSPHYSLPVVPESRLRSPLPRNSAKSRLTLSVW